MYVTNDEDQWTKDEHGRWVNVDSGYDKNEGGEDEDVGDGEEEADEEDG